MSPLVSWGLLKEEVQQARREAAGEEQEQLQKETREKYLVILSLLLLAIYKHIHTRDRSKIEHGEQNLRFVFFSTFFALGGGAVAAVRGEMTFFSEGSDTLSPALTSWSSSSGCFRLLGPVSVSSVNVVLSCFFPNPLDNAASNSAISSGVRSPSMASTSKLVSFDFLTCSFPSPASPLSASCSLTAAACCASASAKAAARSCCNCSSRACSK